jgi:hypothetical protein
MIRPILIHPAPILRDTSAPVPETNDRIRALLDDMLETMYDAQGRGLAAVQIGVLQTLVVIDADWKEGASSSSSIRKLSGRQRQRRRAKSDASPSRTRRKRSYAPTESAYATSTEMASTGPIRARLEN